MELLINRTRDDAKSFDSLADYLYVKMLEAQQSQAKFQFLNPWSWVTLLAGILSVVTFIFLIMLRLKVRTLSVLLLARGLYLFLVFPWFSNCRRHRLPRHILIILQFGPFIFKRFPISYL